MVGKRKIAALLLLLDDVKFYILQLGEAMSVVFEILKYSVYCSGPQ